MTKLSYVFLSAPSGDPNRNPKESMNWRANYDAAQGFEMTLEGETVTIVGKAETILVPWTACKFAIAAAPVQPTVANAPVPVNAPGGLAKHAQTNPAQKGRR